MSKLHWIGAALGCAGCIGMTHSALAQRTDRPERPAAEADEVDTSEFRELLQVLDDLAVAPRDEQPGDTGTVKTPVRQEPATTDEPEADGLEADEIDLTPPLVRAGRLDAELIDLFLFTREDNLVLMVTLDPMLPPGVTEYTFSPDLTVELNIDNDTDVRFEDPAELARYGGTVAEPDGIGPEMTFRFVFGEDGTPRLLGRGVPIDIDGLSMFAGLRQDPFVRPGRNAGFTVALVVQIPLEHVLDEQSTVLVWATSKVDGLKGRFQSLAGRALRSQSPQNVRMNMMQPRRHRKVLGVAPNVAILDTNRPAAYPNGRELTDDVVALMNDRDTLTADAGFPADLTFLQEFPYLPPVPMPEVEE